MRWPWQRHGQPTAEAAHAARSAERGVRDAQAMRGWAAEANRRAEHLAAGLAESRRRNHYGEAVRDSMRRA